MYMSSWKAHREKSIIKGQVANARVPSAFDPFSAPYAQFNAFDDRKIFSFSPSHLNILPVYIWVKCPCKRCSNFCFSFYRLIVSYSSQAIYSFYLNNKLLKP